MKMISVVFSPTHSQKVDDPDIDGIPIDSKNDRSPSATATAAGFIPSKWETVDPEQIEAQAITTSKWETLDPIKESQQPQSNMSEDSFDSFEYSEGTRDYDEEKRMRLREVELKTVQYQDELESGQRNLKSGWTVQQQCEHYRRKLMKRSLRELQQDSPQSRTSSLKRSPSPTDSLKKAKKSRRSPSPQYNRNASSRRSPGHSKRRDSASPSRDRYRKLSSRRSRSRSRSASHSPKRYSDRSDSPTSRSAKYESSSRRHNR